MDVFLPNLLFTISQVAIIAFGILRTVALIIVILCGIKYLKSN